MRDYSKSPGGTWIDFLGRVWPVIQTVRRLKFKYPAHAALRAHVFHAANYCCARCYASAIDVPAGYDGSHALSTNTTVRGRSDVLVVDHVLTLKAGGKNVIANFQALCETCNRKKQREDKSAILAFMGGK